MYVFFKIIIMWHGNKKHWLSGSGFYRSWYSLKDRCRNKNNTSYKNYWWRWIYYCKEWESFDNFYKDMYENYFDWSSIDRIDVDWNYEKDNCRWATRKEQNNNRRNNKVIEIDWEVRNLWEWLSYYWLDRRTYRTRINNWWDDILAITKKPKKYKKSV